MSRAHESFGADIAYMAECQLATLEMMRGAKRTTKYAMERQEVITSFAVGCASLYCTREEVQAFGLPRLAPAIKRLEAQP